jgi:hypothetical protein
MLKRVYAECRYAECCYAECRGTFYAVITEMQNNEKYCNLLRFIFDEKNVEKNNIKQPSLVSKQG